MIAERTPAAKPVADGNRGLFVDVALRYLPLSVSSCTHVHKSCFCVKDKLVGSTKDKL